MAQQHVNSKSRKSDSKFTVSGQAKVEWKGYVNVEITSEAKKALAKFMENGNDPLDWIEGICQEGVYEVKCKWDARNNCWAANLYCAKPGHINAGWSLPARASNFWEALRRVAFIHVEVLKGGWGVGEPTSGWTDDKW